MTREEWKCKQMLQKQVSQAVRMIEKVAKKAQRGNYSAIEEYFDDVCDVKFTIDGNFRYCSVKIMLAVGDPGIYFDSETSKVYGRWGFALSCEKMVDVAACDAVDDYFEEYYNACR